MATGCPHGLQGVASSMVPEGASGQWRPLWAVKMGRDLRVLGGLYVGVGESKRPGEALPEPQALTCTTMRVLLSPLSESCSR